jgi:ABC-type transporter Mla subunit MlaD
MPGVSMNRYRWRRWLLAPIIELLIRLEIHMSANDTALAALTQALTDQGTAITAEIAQVQQLIANGNGNDDISAALNTLASNVTATTAALVASIPAAPAPAPAAPAA